MCIPVFLYFCIPLPQVTYAFCKEFASLLSDLVTPEGDLPVVKILSTIFEQVSREATLPCRAPRRPTCRRRSTGTPSTTSTP